MGHKILRGVSSALIVTVITLLAGMLWQEMGYGGFNISSLVDIGLVLSCITAGLRTGKESGEWLWGGVAALAYVSLSVLLVALFLPISGWGAVQILGEGGLIGILAGAVGAGKASRRSLRGMGWERPFRVNSPSWGEEHEGDKWDSPSKHQERGWSVHMEESGETDEFGSDRESEWEEWIGGVSRQAVANGDGAYSQSRESREQEEYGVRSGKNAWWEEDMH